jgi:HlyD family secretion protein
VDRVRVLIFVDEPELGRVEMGDRVIVTSDGFPGEEWECAIDRLAVSVVSLETRRVGQLGCTVENSERTLIPRRSVEAICALELLVDPRVVGEGLDLPCSDFLCLPFAW